MALSLSPTAAAFCFAMEYNFAKSTVGSIVHDKEMAHFFALQHREGLILKKDAGVTFAVTGTAMDIYGHVVHLLLLAKAVLGRLLVWLLWEVPCVRNTTSPDTCVCAGCDGKLLPHRCCCSALPIGWALQCRSWAKTM